MQRREILKTLPLIGFLPNEVSITYESLPISSNTYNWVTFYKRLGKVWGQDMDSDLRDYAKSGLTAIEPNMESVSMAKEMLPLLKKHGLSMPSIYVNSILHDGNEIEKSINSILDIANFLKNYGTKIIVTNPSPIKWGSEALKSDDQLILQAKAMERLGENLYNLGITLAYHTHDMELKAGAREFHHVMQNTSPKYVKFCFDLHWVYRGSLNSEVAVYDVLKMYGHRIAELHIRQSINGIWSEVFTPKGDIDYVRIAFEFSRMKLKPHLVIEQCVESASPNTVDVVTAHKEDLSQIKSLFSIK